MGVAPLEIAERLGHEKVETTLNTYSHLYPSTQSKLAGLLDKKHEEEEELSLIHILEPCDGILSIT